MACRPWNGYIVQDEITSDCVNLDPKTICTDSSSQIVGLACSNTWESMRSMEGSITVASDDVAHRRDKLCPCVGNPTRGEGGVHFL